MFNNNNEIIGCKKYYNMAPEQLLHNVNKKYFDNITTVHNTLTNTTDSNNLTSNINNKICICSLTECNLGDGIFDLDLGNIQNENKLISNICFGTDSNLRIDSFEELRILEYLQRLKSKKRDIYANKCSNENLSNLLFNIATINGVKTLNLNSGEIKEINLQIPFVLIYRQQRFTLPSNKINNDVSAKFVALPISETAYIFWQKNMRHLNKHVQKKLAIVC